MTLPRTPLTSTVLLKIVLLKAQTLEKDVENFSERYFVDSRQKNTERNLDSFVVSVNICAREARGNAAAVLRLADHVGVGLSPSSLVSVIWRDCLTATQIFEKRA